MLRASLLVLAATGSVAFGQVFQASATWDVGSGGNGHTYSVYWTADGINFANAEANALSLGGHLVTLTSAAENAFVTSALNIPGNTNLWYVDSFGNAIGPWIGGLQQPGAGEPAGGWSWITGETWEYSNWATNEPNNSGGTENRAHFFANGATPDVTWNDITDNLLLRGYVVEVVPTPGSVVLLGAAALMAGRRRR